MPSLLIFNPEHDFALASGRRPFTPPKSVRALRRRLALTMLPLAKPGDFLALPDEIPYAEIEGFRSREDVAASEVILIRDSDIGQPGILQNVDSVIAWGWDHTLVAFLKRKGISPLLLKPDRELDQIRKLSHRDISIAFNRLLAEKGVRNIVVPEKIKDAEEAVWFGELHPGAFFKAPWSSSGRGVVRQGEMTEEKLRQWLTGTIGRQGSVLAETAADKALDFATEWDISGVNILFRGLSLFSTDESGNYKENLPLSQQAILREIQNMAPSFGPELIELQRDVLRELIAGQYEGPVGIDMLAERDGNIRPCVEVNLRMTMGRIELEKTQKIVVIGQGNVATHLAEAFGEYADVVKVNSRTLEGLPGDADLYIISVSDKAVTEVAGRLPKVKGVVAHTSGSIPMDALDGHERRGVFYPLQTFTKGKALTYSEIPIYVEGNSAETEEYMRRIASCISVRVRHADSAKRKVLHLASVFACNFTIRLNGIAAELLEEAGIEFADILPLLGETVDKLKRMEPVEAQTGPAVRGDIPVIEAHLHMLQERKMDKEAEIYRLMSESIAEARDSQTNKNS